MAGWNPSDRSAVLRMLLDRRPFSFIGKALSLSRSAVAGRIFRDPELKQAVRNAPHGPSYKRSVTPVGLVIKAMPVQPKIPEQRTPKPAPVPKPETNELDTLMADENKKGVPLADIMSGMCRWPLWEASGATADFPMCGDPIKPDAVYCREHAARAFTGTRRSDTSLAQTRAPRLR